MREDQAEALATELTRRTGKNWQRPYYESVRPKGVNKDPQGNAILTHFAMPQQYRSTRSVDIKDHADREPKDARKLLRALVILPGGQRLLVYTTHLAPSRPAMVYGEDDEDREKPGAPRNVEYRLRQAALVRD